MSSSITWCAPAKLNLFLHITAQRADGYHCLQTIFQFINFKDILHFEVRSDGQLSCQCSVTQLANEHNLAWRAAQLLKQYTGTPLGVNILIEKKIPLGGGLGGGSSNAATTLLALNQLWQLQLSSAIIMQLSLSLGADVPIFVYGHAAWAEGIGEQLTQVVLAEPWYLVIHPGCHVLTADIFAAEELTRDSLPITIGAFLAGQSRNDCEPIVCQRYPQVQHSLAWLNQFAPARMTGTGACIFASFDTQAQAQAVLAQLPAQWQGFIAQGQNISPALSGSNFGSD